MMTAARLVSENDETMDVESEPASRIATQEAIAFLEEVGDREDGGANAWMLSSIPRVGTGIYGSGRRCADV